MVILDAVAVTTALLALVPGPAVLLLIAGLTLGSVPRSTSPAAPGR